MLIPATLDPVMQHVHRVLIPSSRFDSICKARAISRLLINSCSCRLRAELLPRASADASDVPGQIIRTVAFIKQVCCFYQ